MSNIYEVKVVTGGTPGATEYDEANVSRAETQSGAVRAALALPGTKDVLVRGRKVARVHVDGGVDYEPSAPAFQVVGTAKDDRSERVAFVGTEEECEEYAERNESPDNYERYSVRPIGEEA